ncbi:hypothetical protein LCGC14_1646650 [marine sediment metagenome]|uniref:Nucleoside 2-deoxyribosyltransferase n=1 Tax=marine sediment metagenome TaxID=412755 RepID=A0A0F9KXY1_9ZZZZ
MSKPIVYACGPMAGLTWEQMNAWRDRAREALPEVELLSPTRGKDWIRQESKPLHGGAYPRLFGSQNAIIRRDYWDVTRSALILANFLHPATCPGEGCEEPIASIGSCFEIAWAYPLGTPVISIVPERSPMHHVFPRAGTLEMVEDEEAAFHVARVLLNLDDAHSVCC